MIMHAYIHWLLILMRFLLNNSTGEVLTSFTYKMTNIESSYNNALTTLYNYSRYKYYDYVESRGFNLPTTDWPSCQYGVKHSKSIPVIYVGAILEIDLCNAGYYL